MDVQDDRDPLLEVWVHQADDGALAGLPVTLMVGGLLVSGTLVGIHQYMEGIANEFRNAPGASEGIGPVLADVFDDAAAGRYDHSEHEAPADGDGDPGAEQDAHRCFIHLEDVRVLDPQGHAARAAWWRGRLTAVDAFMYGTPS
jgi:hypothetical protein